MTQQWKRDLQQGLNNATTETNLNYLKILQQRPLADESVCIIFFMYLAASRHFDLRFIEVEASMHRIFM